MKLLGRAAIACVAVFLCQRTLADGADLFATSWTEGKRADADRALPPTPFYESPSHSDPGKPGSLIRSEPAQEYVLPAGVTAPASSITRKPRPVWTQCPPASSCCHTENPPQAGGR